MSSKTATTSSTNNKKKKKEPNKKDLGFLDSTHFKHWIFKSVDEISSKRLKSLNNTINTYNLIDSKNKLVIPSSIEYTSSISYYSKEIIEICRQFKLPEYVSCTAVTYFKRFYINNNMISVDAMSMKDTSIYLASKVEQCLISVKQLEIVTKVPASKIVQNEIILLDGLKFHLKIWNPYRSYRCLLKDFKAVFRQKHSTGLDVSFANQINIQSMRLIQDSYISDVCLIYPPSQIALSCLLLVLSNINYKINNNNPKLIEYKLKIKNMSTEYFNIRFGRNKDNAIKLKNVTQNIQKLIIKSITETNNNNNFKQIQKNANTKIYKLQCEYVKKIKIKNLKKKKIKIKLKNKTKTKTKSGQKRTQTINLKNVPNQPKNKKFKHQ